MSYAEVIHTFPAYKICKMFTKEVNGRETKILPVEAKVCTMKQTARHGLLPTLYSPGNVAAYALKYNECPIEAMAKCKAKGEQLYWLNNCSVSITAWAKPQETIFLIEVGDRVWYAGKVFEIQYYNKWSKEHLKLVEVDLEAELAADMAALAEADAYCPANENEFPNGEFAPQAGVGPAY